MRRLCTGLGWLAAVLLCLPGCWNTRSHLIPPKQPEEFRPPPSDPRFCSPPQFPRETLESSIIKRPVSSMPTGKSGGRIGASSMGGGY